MKRMIKLILFIVVVLALASCTSMKFDPVVNGYDLPDPVVEDVLGHAIRVTCMQYRWLPIEDEPGRIVARFQKGEGVIAVDIEIDYDSEGWTVTYLRSKNLDYNKRRSTIHKNYVRWIANLNKGIYSEYMDKIG